MAEFLILLGLLSFGCIIILVGVFVWEFIDETISRLKQRYRYKHRFDKPPIAKCYCIDCRWHNNEDSRCYRFHEKDRRLTADHCFCYEAEPRKKEV